MRPTDSQGVVPTSLSISSVRDNKLVATCYEQPCISQSCWNNLYSKSVTVINLITSYVPNDQTCHNNWEQATHHDIGLTTTLLQLVNNVFGQSITMTVFLSNLAQILTSCSCSKMNVRSRLSVCMFHRRKTHSLRFSLPKIL